MSEPLEYETPNPQRVSLKLVVATAIAAGLCVVVMLMLSASSRPKPYFAYGLCASNLRQIGMACALYADEFGGQYPPSLDAAYITQWFTTDVFVCSSTMHTPNPSTQPAKLTFGQDLSYVYLGADLTASSAPTEIVAIEPAHHTIDGLPMFQLVLKDGSVDRLPRDEMEPVLDDLVAQGRLAPELRDVLLEHDR
ncbi:MAG: hypothetical protein AAF743_04290 [Planctomycetota bacterium]